MTNKLKKAIVLGGGGHFGNSWELGYLRGLEDAGLDMRGADIIVGTSAGSQIGTMIASDQSWDDIWEKQFERDLNETTPITDAEMANLYVEYDQAEDLTSAKKWIENMGKISSRTKAFLTTEKRLALMKNRFGTTPPQWTDNLRIVATELETSERRVFDQHSGVDILDALVASSALPGVWPAIEIQGKHYFDGGSYSMENPDVVTDADKMLVISTNLPVKTPYKINELIENLNQQGTKTELTIPNAEVLAVLKKFNFNTMESAIRPEAAATGYQQGLQDAKRISQLWN